MRAMFFQKNYILQKKAVTSEIIMVYGSSKAFRKAETMFLRKKHPGKKSQVLRKKKKKLKKI